MFCRLRREEAPGDPRFSLQRTLQGSILLIFIGIVVPQRSLSGPSGSLKSFVSPYSSFLHVADFTSLFCGWPVCRGLSLPGAYIYLFLLLRDLRMTRCGRKKAYTRPRCKYLTTTCTSGTSRCTYGPYIPLPPPTVHTVAALPLWVWVASPPLSDSAGLPSSTE